MIDWTACSDAELTALVRALHEARFAEEPDDPLLWKSPIVVDLHVAVLAEQRRRGAGRRRSGAVAEERWLAWRNRPERSTVVRRLARDPELLRLAGEDGGRSLRQLLRPFVLDDADVEELLRQVRAHSAHAEEGGT